MRLAVLGSTGGTGREVVLQALESSHDVLALARNPDKLSDITHPRLEVRKGDVFSEADLAGHFTGCDAVVSCLGVTGLFFPWSNVTITQDTIKVIVAAMQRAGVPRLVVMSSACAVAKEGNPFFVEWVAKPLLLKGAFQDLAAMEQYLESIEDPDLQYTVLKPPQLINGEKTDSVIQTAEGEEHVRDAGMFIRRSDVARFILDCLATDAWNRKRVAIGV